MNKLIFYTTAGCHLCEQAAELLQNLQIPFEYRDIIEQQQWLDAYRVRIPVVTNETDQELDWPFDAPELQQFCLSLNTNRGHRVPVNPC